MLDADIASVEEAVNRALPDLYSRLDEVRQRVLVDTAFNMGRRALGFARTIAALRRDDYVTAARELQASAWSHQVGDGPGGRMDRGDRLATMLRSGTDYTT